MNASSLPLRIGFCLAFIAGLGLAAPPVPAKEPDVLVYGGTPGGIASAIAAAREGCTVRLIETTKHLGGLTTGGLSHTDVGPKPELIGGIAREFYTRADAHYADPKRTA